MAKKTFKENINPAMNFISQESIKEAEQPAEVCAPPQGYKLNPLYIETKSERIQLLMQPSLKAKLKARAAKEGKSFNETVHSILAAALDNDNKE